MASNGPPQLHLSVSSNGTSFKRTFEQYGFDLDSPPANGDPAGNVSGSGGGRSVQPGSSTDGGERNKRARSTSSSTSSNSSTSFGSSEYETAESSSSTSFSGGDHDIPSALPRSRSVTLARPSPAAPSHSHQTNHMVLEPRREVVMDVVPPLSLEAQRSLSPVTHSLPSTEEGYRRSMERYNEFDSHISALRRSHSRTPSTAPTPPPTLPPMTFSLPDEDAITEASSHSWFSSSTIPSSHSLRSDARDSTHSSTQTRESFDHVSPPIDFYEPPHLSTVFEPEGPSSRTDSSSSDSNPNSSIEALYFHLPTYLPYPTYHPPSRALSPIDTYTDEPDSHVLPSSPVVDRLVGRYTSAPSATSRQATSTSEIRGDATDEHSLRDSAREIMDRFRLSRSSQRRSHNPAAVLQELLRRGPGAPDSSDSDEAPRRSFTDRVPRTNHPSSYHDALARRQAQFERHSYEQQRTGSTHVPSQASHQSPVFDSDPSEARSIFGAGLSSRPELPSTTSTEMPQHAPRGSFRSRLYTSSTPPSNTLMSESAAERRRTSAREQLLSRLSGLAGALSSLEHDEELGSRPSRSTFTSSSEPREVELPSYRSRSPRGNTTRDESNLLSHMARNTAFFAQPEEPTGMPETSPYRRTSGSNARNDNEHDNGLMFSLLGHERSYSNRTSERGHMPVIPDSTDWRRPRRERDFGGLASNQHPSASPSGPLSIRYPRHPIFSDDLMDASSPTSTQNSSNVAGDVDMLHGDQFSPDTSLQSEVRSRNPLYRYTPPPSSSRETRMHASLALPVVPGRTVPSDGYSFPYGNIDLEAYEEGPFRDSIQRMVQLEQMRRRPLTLDEELSSETTPELSPFTDPRPAHAEYRRRPTPSPIVPLSVPLNSERRRGIRRNPSSETANNSPAPFTFASRPSWGSIPNAREEAPTVHHHHPTHSHNSSGNGQSRPSSPFRSQGPVIPQMEEFDLRAMSSFTQHLDRDRSRRNVASETQRMDSFGSRNEYGRLFGGPNRMHFDTASNPRPSTGAPVDPPHARTSNTFIPNEDVSREGPRAEQGDRHSRSPIQGLRFALEMFREDGFSRSRPRPPPDRFDMDWDLPEIPTLSWAETANESSGPGFSPQQRHRAAMHSLRARLSLPPASRAPASGANRPQPGGTSFTNRLARASSRSPPPHRHERDRSSMEERHARIRAMRRGMQLQRSTETPPWGSRFGRPLGDYMPDEDFDSSYESLLSLAATLGEVKSKATPDDVIASLPTAPYKEWATEESDQRCPICLDDYLPSDPVLKLLECSHWLHKGCLETWLHNANTCPVCRKKVKPSRRGQCDGSPGGPSRNRRRDSDDSEDRGPNRGPSVFGTLGTYPPGPPPWRMW